MKDKDKTREQLITELSQARQRLAKLESLETDQRQLAKALLQGQEGNLLRILMDNLPDYIFIKNTQSQFVTNNIAHVHILGAKTPEEVVGKTDFDFFPKELALKYYRDEQKVIDTGQPLINLEEPVIGPTGDTRWVSTTKVPVSDSQKRIVGVVGMSRDITDRKETEAILGQRAAQLALISDISSKISSVMELDSLLNRAAILVQETFGYHHVALFLLEGDTARLRAVAGSYKSYFPTHHSQKLSEGIIGWVATQGEPLVTNDVSLEPRYISAIPNRTETQAELCLPIKVAGQTVGVLNIQSPQKDAFTDNDVTAMKILTDQVAVAIENVRLYEAAQQELTERRRAEEELKRYRDHLEELVEGRTIQLRTANEQLQQEIIERRRIEEALRESEERFRTLANFTYDWEYWVGADGHYIYVSPSCERITGYRADEFLKNPRLLEAMTHPDDQEMVSRHHKEELSGNEMTAIDFRIISRSGEERWIGHVCQPVYSEEGHLLGSRASNRDITKRKRMEEELRRTAKRLRVLQEIDRSILAAQSPEAIAAAAIQHIQQLVPCFRATVVEFDYKAQEGVVLADYLNGKPRADSGTRQPLNVGEIAEGLRRGKVRVVRSVPRAKTSSSGLGAGRVETVRSYMDVPLVAAGDLIGIINLEAGRPNAFAAEHIDIAREVADQLALAIQQARLYEQVRRHAIELEQRVAERTARLQEINDELESFTFSVSHDLRAPLRGVQGFADALLDDYADRLDEEGQEYTQRIVAAAERMDKLIQDLLAYSRLGRTDLRVQPVNLASVLGDVLAQLEIELQEQQAKLDIQESLPWVMGHHGTLVQVVANVLTNAVKFVPPGQQPHVEITATKEDKWIRLEVKDNGIGIEPEHSNRVFHIFERLHGIETYPGTGVGLAIVRRGVARLGGRAGVESTPGQGSTFWIELPGAEEQ